MNNPARMRYPACPSPGARPPREASSIVQSFARTRGYTDAPSVRGRGIPIEVLLLLNLLPSPRGLPACMRANARVVQP